MLGAGLDPLNKDQDFSVLAKTGKNLMAAHFVKPSATKTRYPPIINVFSRCNDIAWAVILIIRYNDITCMIIVFILFDVVT